ncbi:hypothetical protein HN011_005026 [Eciton burchellii]|nr:hypothetical protein HN011_005026 [Eciton burchellii]
MESTSPGKPLLASVPRAPPRRSGFRLLGHPNYYDNNELQVHLADLLKQDAFPAILDESCSDILDEVTRSVKWRAHAHLYPTIASDKPESPSLIPINSV